MNPSLTRLLCAICVTCGFILPYSSSAQAPTIPPTGVRGYVYVEPFEIRKEFVLPLKHLVDTLGLPADAAIDAPARETILESLARRLSGACPILADGIPLAFELDRIEFVVIDPQTGISPEVREIVPLPGATVGAVFVLTREAPPARLDITWDFFPDDKGEVPVALEVSSGTSMEFFNHLLTFTPATNRQTWDLPETGAPPALLAVAPPPRASVLLAFAPGAGFFLLGIVLLIKSRRYLEVLRRTVQKVAIGLFLVGAIALSAAFASQPSSLKEADACALVDALLHNIYYAFAYRDESRIFDTLATSVAGDLLEDLYLDIRGGLELENAGGPRVKIHKVVLGECTPDMGSPPGFRASAAWTAAGNVSHWGHIHPRRNKYRGELTIEPLDGAWKVTGVQILEEERQ